MELSINYQLLIAKLHAYGFSIESLEIILIYLQVGGKELRSIQLLVLGLG